MYPLSKAFTISVDMAGENKAAWTKDTNSAAMAEPTAALASGVCDGLGEREHHCVQRRH